MIPALEELKALPQWVGWKIEADKDGKPTKVPYVANNGKHAKSTDRTTWVEFASAAQAYRAAGHEGLGFVVTSNDPYCGIDLDKCRNSETKAIADWAIAIVKRFDSYTEISPSKTGLRIWIKARKSGTNCAKPMGAGKLEVYDRARFFTVTGAHLDGTPTTIEDRQAEYDEFYAEQWPEKVSSNDTGRKSTTSLTAYQINELARHAKNAAKWDRLMQGDLSDYNGDDSRADAALCALAGFYTDDHGVIDQIVRMSGLCREKWTERQDYRDRTISKALELVTERHSSTGEVRTPNKATVSVDQPAGPLPKGVTTAGRARLYDLSAYRPDLERTETDWLIDSWLVRGQIHQFVGEEKRGKSTQQWRRIGAISRGDKYFESQAYQKKVLAITEMSPDGITTLLDDDDIEVDWSMVRIAFVDEIPREDRLAVIGEAVKEWKPTYLALDPIDECLGLDENGVFNPAKTADGFEVIRQWANAGMTVDALYHYNNKGKIANSYKFRAKPDHIFRIRGSDPSDVTYEYQGRVRTIPRKRRITGNGDEGYKVDNIGGGQPGRPAKSRQLIHEALRASTVPLQIAELSKATGLPYQAAKQAVFRGVKKHELEHDEGRGYRLADGYEKPGSTVSALPYPSTAPNVKDRYESQISRKDGGFVPFGQKAQVGYERVSACGHSNVQLVDELLTCQSCGLTRRPAEAWLA